MTYEIAEFKMTNEAIANFNRWVKLPKDCVINALEYLRILDSKMANIARIMVGNNGLTSSQIIEIFSYIKPTENWVFYKFTQIKTLSEFINKLKPNHAIFCGYKGKYKHVFLIAKDKNKKIVLIDAQRKTPMCDLTEESCKNFIKDKEAYYILQSSQKN